MAWLRRGKLKQEQQEQPQSLARANPYDFQIAHKRLAWTARLLAGTTMGLCLALGFTISALTSLVPLKEVRPYLIKTAPADNRIYTIEPLAVTADGFELYLQERAMRFVKDLLEVDAATQQFRLEKAFAMMARDYRTDWKEANLESIRKSIAEGFSRTIQIQSASKQRFFEKQREWQIAVNFIQQDDEDGKPIREQPLTAYLKMTTATQSVPEAQKLENPLGVQVLNMTIKKQQFVKDTAP